MNTKLSLLLGSILLTTGVATAPVQAATLACSSTVAGQVTGIASCEVSTTASQDFLNTNPMTVNSEAFFNFTDWAFGGKIGVDKDYLGTKEGQSGIWDLSKVVQNTWNDVMLVFKSGNNTTLTSYLLQDGITSGSWTSPFLTDKNPKDVSHISVYYRVGEPDQPSTAVPEPTALMALGLVGGGMFFSRRRQTAS